MQRLAIGVLDEGHFLIEDGIAGGADDARHEGRLGEPLLLHQQLESPKPATAGRHLEQAGLLALLIHHGADAEALDEAATGDRDRQVVDRNAGLHAPDVPRSEEHTPELQSLIRTSYAVFCLK